MREKEKEREREREREGERERKRERERIIISFPPPPPVRPTCAEDQQWTYGSGRGEQVNVTCRVHAHPDAHSFRWAFNTSAELLNIPQNSTHALRDSSTVSYTPMTHHDFGTLLCWAVNEVGGQLLPCVFLIVPAGKGGEGRGEGQMDKNGIGVRVVGHRGT